MRGDSTNEEEVRGEEGYFLGVIVNAIGSAIHQVHPSGTVHDSPRLVSVTAIA